MGDREDEVYKAKLAEQAERYEGSSAIASTEKYLFLNLFRDLSMLIFLSSVFEGLKYALIGLKMVGLSINAIDY